MKTKINEIENNILDTSSLVTRSVLNTKINKTENTILDSTRLMTRSVLNIKINEDENKTLDFAKYIITQKFITENFAARLKQPNLVSKTDLNWFKKNKLTSFDKQTTLKQNN